MAEDTSEQASDDSGGLAPGEWPEDIERWPIDEVHPYVNNPKEHPDEQVEKIASSIKNYGWDQPIVVDGDGEIIKGHGRRQAAQVLGLDEVPVIVREDLGEAEKKAARIADNRTAESAWDAQTLATEFEVLQEDEALEMDVEEATAFDQDEVEDYFERMDRPEEDEWLDEFDDDQMEPDSEPGDSEDKKHITLLLPESRHEQLMDHLDSYEGGKDDSFVAWMDDTLGKPDDEGPEGMDGAGPAQGTSAANGDADGEASGDAPEGGKSDAEALAELEEQVGDVTPGMDATGE